ncbi:hypothetical protein ACMHYB_48150 [Sorangium sp. So ce1128]
MGSTSGGGAGGSGGAGTAESASSSGGAGGDSTGDGGSAGAGGAGDGRSMGCGEAVTRPDPRTQQTLMVGGVTRYYLMYVPGQSLSDARARALTSRREQRELHLYHIARPARTRGAAARANKWLCSAREAGPPPPRSLRGPPRCNCSIN